MTNPILWARVSPYHDCWHALAVVEPAGGYAPTYCGCTASRLNLREATPDPPTERRCKTCIGALHARGLLPLTAPLTDRLADLLCQDVTSDSPWADTERIPCYAGVIFRALDDGTVEAKAVALNKDPEDDWSYITRLWRDGSHMVGIGENWQSALEDLYERGNI